MTARDPPDPAYQLHFHPLPPSNCNTSVLQDFFRTQLGTSFCQNVQLFSDTGSITFTDISFRNYILENRPVMVLFFLYPLVLSYCFP